MKVVSRFEDAVKAIQSDEVMLDMYGQYLTGYSIMSIEDDFWDRFLAGEELAHSEYEGGPTTCRRIVARDGHGDFFVPLVCFEEKSDGN